MSLPLTQFVNYKCAAHLACVICEEIPQPENLYITSCCNCVYCKFCYQDRAEEVCYNCKSVIDGVHFLSYYASIILLNRLVHCKMFPQCEFIGRFIDIQAHYLTCDHCIVKCKYLGCTVHEMPRKDMKEHEKTCPYRIQVSSVRYINRKTNIVFKIV